MGEGTGAVTVPWLKRAACGVATVALALGAQAMAAPSPAQAATTVDITIGQFNMAGGNKDYGWRGNEVPDALIRSIEGRSPKLAFVTINEGCEDWLRYLDGKLADYSVAFNAVRTGSGEVARCRATPEGEDDYTPRHESDFGNAVIYRDDLGIDGADDHDLGTPEGEKREMFCVKSTAKRIVICSVHLTSDNSDHRKREGAEAKRILATTYAGYTKFVGGDLNAKPLEEELNNFYHTGYGFDAAGEFKEVDSPCRNTISETLLEYPLYGPCRDGEPTHVSFDLGGIITLYKKIDYIFVSPSVFVRSADATSSTYSDHDPLFADVTFTYDDGGGGGGDPFPEDPADYPPNVDAGPRASGVEGAPIALRGSASDREGEPTLTWSYQPAGAVDPGTSCAFADPSAAQTTITCTDDGVFTATLTARDGVNLPVSDSADVTVHNAAPKLRLTSPTPWQVFRAGTPVTLTAPFTDAGQDTHTCTVNWDDGAGADSYPASAMACDRTHTFPHAGMYTINVTVADDDGGKDTKQVMIIVYDPNAGYPTAGGLLEVQPEIVSPVGALPAAPTSSGKAHLQINPKYQPGEVGPGPSTGKVSFTFPDAGFSLDSTSLDWLAVAPGGKAAAKGAATVNGTPGYGFVVYVYDEPDSFRLLVWNLASGPVPSGTLAYDNVEGAGYDLDVANPQPISKGSISIHY
jgi:endonuclease/exonuclease/phosphatase family metal-dependent hydrolase